MSRRDHGPLWNSPPCQVSCASLYPIWNRRCGSGEAEVSMAATTVGIPAAFSEIRVSGLIRTDSSDHPGSVLINRSGLDRNNLLRFHTWAGNGRGASRSILKRMKPRGPGNPAEPAPWGGYRGNCSERNSLFASQGVLNSARCAVRCLRGCGRYWRGGARRPAASARVPE